MPLKKILQNYQTGMAAYERCHPPSLTSQWQAFQSEVTEFFAQPTVSEGWDVLHSGGRFLCKLTGIPLYLLAWPTVYKHSQRYATRGCIRSQRNCEGRCCVPLSSKPSC